MDGRREPPAAVSCSRNLTRNSNGVYGMRLFHEEYVSQTDFLFDLNSGSRLSCAAEPQLQVDFSSGCRCAFLASCPAFWIRLGGGSPLWAGLRTASNRSRTDRFPMTRISGNVCHCVNRCGRLDGSIRPALVRRPLPDRSAAFSASGYSCQLQQAGLQRCTGNWRLRLRKGI